MRISFYSFSDDENIRFEAEGSKKDNVISFYDKNNILIEYLINDELDMLEIKRTGNVTSSMKFIAGRKTTSKYQTDDGLDIDFDIECKNLKFENNKIMVEYALGLDGNIINNYKIWLLIH